LALKTFVDGEVLQAADVNLYLKNTIFAYKTATETVVSSTTLQDDNDLTVSVAASSVYVLDAMLKYDSSTTSDLKISWVGPAGATLSWTATVLIEAAASQQDVQMLPGAALGASSVLGVASAGGTTYAFIRGLLVVAGTAGTFKLQWAQQTSGGTNTNMLADSYIFLRRVS
jgi:hypothetical protein